MRRQLLNRQSSSNNLICKELHVDTHCGKFSIVMLGPVGKTWSELRARVITPKTFVKHLLDKLCPAQHSTAQHRTAQLYSYCPLPSPPPPHTHITTEFPAISTARSRTPFWRIFCDTLRAVAHFPRVNERQSWALEVFFNFFNNKKRF